MSLTHWLFRKRRNRGPGFRKADVRRHGRRTRGVARSSPAWSAQLEQLEPRQLMALVIDAGTDLSAYLNSGAYTFHDSESITVSPGAVIDGGSLGITFDSPSITIGDSASIKTTAGLTLTAKKTYVDVPQLTMWNQVLSIVEAIEGTQATVSIGTGTMIQAGSFTITATAGDDSSGINKATGITGLGQFVSGLLQYVNDLSALPLSGQVKQPTAKVTLASGVSIVSAGDVSITTAATADATGEAVYSIYADYLVKHKAGWQKDGAYGFGAAAGISYVDAAAETMLADDVTITADGGVSIDSKVTGTAAMSSRTTLNQGNQQTNPNNIEVAYAGTYLESTSRITVSAGSHIDAKDAVTIAATTKNKNKVKANTASYRDGLAGVTIGTGFGFGTAEVIVDGRITAGMVNRPTTLAFDPLLAVDYKASRIVFAEASGFETGDAIRYDTARGGGIPGLKPGETYHAVVDPAHPMRLGLALTRADALAGRSIDFGGGYPTLTTAKGSIPITRVDAAFANAIRFDLATWPDGGPLVSDGERVTFTPVAGKFLGRQAADGSVVELAAGTYTVRVLPPSDDQIGMAIQLLDGTGAVIDLNDNPQFRSDDGRIYQVASFDADSGEISFNFPQGTPENPLPYPVPAQTIDLTNAQPIMYVAALGTDVSGLVDGRRYFAIVDPKSPGVIRLAATEGQAHAADPVRQRGVPALSIDSKTIPIDNIEPGTGLVFGTNPALPDGTAVVYHAVEGKPVGGLVDGTTYYAYSIANPDFSADWPQYILGLRATPDATGELIDLFLSQGLVADGVEYPIAGVDTSAGKLAVALPGTIELAGNGGALTDGSLAIATVTPGSFQAFTTATEGTFKVLLRVAGSETPVATDAIPFDAPPAVLQAAINKAAMASGLDGIEVTGGFGKGTRPSPWTLTGSGLDQLEIDDDALQDGGGFARLAPSGLEAVSTTASGGTFTLNITGDGLDATTAPIPSDATAAEVKAAVEAVSGVIVDGITGSGRADDPWVVAIHRQPLATGDAVVFRDGWGATSYGLVDGRTYYVVLGPPESNGKAGAVVVGLAETREAALAANPTTVPLVSALEFLVPDVSFPSGTRHTLSSTVEGTGIDITATLSSGDSQSTKSANGSEPKLKDLLTRGDFAYKPGNWKGVAKNIFDWTTKDEKGKGVNSPLASRIEKMVGKQADGKSAVNEWLTVSASASSLKIDNIARVIIGSTSELVTAGTVNLASTVIESIQSNVEGTVSKPGKGNLGVALAVDVVQVWNTAHTIVQANAKVTGGAGVTVDSEIAYPWAGQMTIADPSNPDDWKEYFEDDTMKFLSTLVGGKLGVDQWFVNHWSNVGIKQNAKDKPIDKSIAGSVAWVGFVNDATAWVEEGAHVNADTSVAAVNGQPVSVTASTDIAQTGFAGTVYLDLSPDAISKKIRRGEEFFNSQVVLEQGKNTYGGSVGTMEIENTTRALIGGLETETVDGVTRPIRTPLGPTVVTAGAGGLTVDATNQLLLVQIGQAGGNAANTGFSGTAAVLDAKNEGTKQIVEAGIVAGSDPSRRAVITSAGGVDVAAADTTFLIPVAGAVLISGNRGAGASTAIALLDRDVTARIGEREEGAAPGPLDVTATGGITVKSAADGAVTPSALAAAVTSTVEAKGDSKAGAANPNGGAGPEGQFGLAISGDYVQASIDDAVRAIVSAAGSLHTLTTGSSLLVSAVNTSLVQATAGAASWLSNNTSGSSFGLAGSAAVITGSSTVTAAVREVGLIGLSLDVTALNARRLGSLAVGGSGERTGSGTSVSVVGSVTVVETTTTTLATVDAATSPSNNLTGLNVSATTDDTVWSVAGSFMVGFSLKPKEGEEAESRGTNVGIGTAVAVQDIKTTTTATVENATLVLSTGVVGINAKDTTGAYAFSAGMTASAKSVSVDGMFTFVTNDSSTTAAVDDGSVTAAGNVDVLATSAVLVVAASGDLVIGRGSRGAIGAAVTSVKSSVSGTSRVGRGAKLSARRGRLSVRSENRQGDPDEGIDALLAKLSTPNRGSNAVWAFAAGAIVSIDASRGSDQASVVTTSLAPTIHASVAEGAILSAEDGSILVQASDAAGIYSGAGGVDFDLGALGAAVASNTLRPSVTAIIDTATLSAAGTGTGSGGVTVDAVNSGLIGTAAAGVALAGKLGGGTSLVFNSIPYSEVRAQIRGTSATQAKVTATRDVVVTAADRSTIGAGAGEIDGVSGGAAGGAAAATNTIHTAVDAAILEATVTSSGGTIKVDADAAATIDAYAVGVAGAWSGGEASVRFDGTGSGTGNTLTRHISGRVQHSTLISKGLSITAEDRATISTAAGSLGVQKSGASTVSAAVGVSASTNDIGSAGSHGFVTAKLENSNVTVHGDLRVEATANLDIEAITAAGAGDFSSGAGVVGFAGAGSGSGNTLYADVTAAISSSTVAQDTSGGVTVAAANSSKVLAVAGGVEVAGGSAEKAEGVKVSVGAAAAVNTVGGATTALLDHATISKALAVTVKADGSQAIEAVAAGVAGAVSTGAGSLFDFAGAGSGSGNTVTSDVLASVTGSSTIGTSSSRVGAVHVTSTNDSSVVAGTGSLGVTFGLESLIGLSVGVSVSENRVSGSVASVIETGSVYSSADVSVTADFTTGQDDHTIEAISIAGSGGVAAVASLDGAGAGVTNTVAIDTKALIQSAATINATGSVTVAATDDSSIYANAGGTALGLTWDGAVGGGVAVGAATATSSITGTVRAALEGATVTAGKEVAIKAISKRGIESISFGVALDVTVAIGGVSAAGSGAAISTQLGGTVEAGILSGTTKATGGIAVSATDKAAIKSGAGAGSLAATVGVGLALAPGVVTIDDKVSTGVTAHIATLGSGAAPTVTGGGALAIDALSAATVDSTGVAVAASAAIGEFDAALSGSGAHTAVTVARPVTAAIDSGTVHGATVSVTTTDHHSIKNVVGSGAGAVGLVGGSIGVSLTESAVNDTVIARIGPATVSATAGGMTIDATAGHAIESESVATAVAITIGGSGAGGHAYATDTSSVAATVQKGAVVSATAGLEVSVGGVPKGSVADDLTISALAHGGSGGLATVGVVIGKATDATTRRASIGDSVDLSKVQSLAVRAAATPSLVGRSVAVDVGGVAVTVNQSTATSMGVVEAFTGSGVTLPGGDVSIIADAAVALDVEQTGVTAAGLAFGATQSTAETGLATSAWLGADTKTSSSRQGGLVVRAKSHDLTHVTAVAGGGGIFGSAIGSTGDIIDNTTTAASIKGGSVHAGTATIVADRTHDYDIDVKSYPASVVVAVGIAQATFTATGANVSTTIAGGTAIKTSGTFALDAAHRIRHQADAYTIDGVGVAVGGSGVQSQSIVKAPVDATITVGDKASIYSGLDPLAHPGGIVIVPTAELRVNDKLQLTNIGLLANGGRITSSVTSTVSPRVMIGNNASLTTFGDLDIGTVAIVDAAATIAGFGAAAFGGTGGIASVNVTVNENVTVGENASLTADGTLSLTPGTDPTARSGTQLQLDAASRVKDYGIVGLPFSTATSDLHHAVTLDVAAGTKVAAGADVVLSAHTGTPSVTAVGLAEGDTLGVPTTGGTSSPSITSTSMLKLAGSYTAGREPSLSITIPNDKNGHFTDTLRSTPSAIFGRTIGSTFRYDDGFKPRDYIDRAGLDPATASVLKQGVAAGPVGAILFEKPLVVSGGSIYAAGDVVSASGASFTAHVGQITIRNESPDYLVLGETKIVNVDGGKVDFRGADGQSVGTDPAGATINRDPLQPRITVEQVYEGNVGGVSFGPAVLVGGAIENMGGVVSITNTNGSFGQSATIAAEEIHVDTPNGVFAANLPTQDWSASGTPSAQAQDQAGLMHWPGGSRVNGNGNHAAMEAVNALSSNTEQYVDTRNAKSEEDLYFHLYGTKTEDRSQAYVFFGPTVPYWSHGHSDKSTVEAVARTVRPDGTSAVKLLGDYIKKDLDYGYLVTPQKLPHEFESNSFSPPSGSQPAVKGQVIVIHAKTVNINGTIEAAGFTGDKSVTLDTTLETHLQNYQSDYQKGVQGKGPKKDRLYRIPGNLLHTRRSTDSVIGGSFDAETGRIILDDAASGGSSRVSITGEIINTAAGNLAGRIRVAGGSGRISVTNDTSFVLEVGGLHAGASDGRATVSITDALVTTASQRQTTWVHEGTGITVYRGEANRDLTTGVPWKTISGFTTTYDPVPHARWQWQLTAGLARSVTGDRSNGYSAGNWSFVDPSNPWKPVGDAGAGSVQIDNRTAIFRQELSATAGDFLGGANMGYKSNRGAWDSKHNPNISYDRQFMFPQRIDMTMTSSLKADHPIAIDFTGSSTETSGVYVVSKGGLFLGGDVEGRHVSLNVNGAGGSIASALQADISTPGLSVSALGPIGGPLPLVINADSLSVTSTTGDIHLAINRDQPQRNIHVDKLVAEQGDVRVLAGGTVVGGTTFSYGGASVDVVTKSLAVQSLEGGIILDVAPPTGHTATEIDVLAPQSIAIDQVVGDMVVRRAHQTRLLATVEPNRSFGRGETIVESPNGRFQLVMQTDGNAVLYDRAESPHRAVWDTKTHQTATKGATARFSDGEFLISDAAGKTVFRSDAGVKQGQMRLSDDGWLAIVNRLSLVVWTAHAPRFTGDELMDASVVLLAEGGNIFDAVAMGFDENQDTLRTTAYESVGATDPNAYRTDVTAFEQQVAGRYELHWKLRDSGTIESERLRIRETAVPLWRTSAEQARLAAGGKPFPETLTAEHVAEVIDHAAKLFEETARFFDDSLPTGWRDTPAFKEYRGIGFGSSADRFHFKASPEQVAAFQAARTSLTSSQLAVRIPASAFLETTTADLLPGGSATVSGGTVVLDAKGSVGKVDLPITITGAAVRSGSLTATELSELKLARLPGDAARDVNADGSLKSLTLTVRRPVSVNAYEGFAAEADTGDVAVVQKHGDLAIDSIDAAKGQVHVVAEKSIRNHAAGSTGITARVPASNEKLPTVRLFSLLGSVGKKDDMLAVKGRHEVVAPKGEIHTNPPPSVQATIGNVLHVLPDGTPIVKQLQLNLPALLQGHRYLFSTQRPESGRARWARAIPKPRHGLNRIWIVHVNAQGHRSSPVLVKFVFDRRPPAAPRVRLAGDAATPGQLAITRVEPNAKLIYSVNGGAWTDSYEPVQGTNIVRVRQIDVAGNVSRASVIRFRA